MQKTRQQFEQALNQCHQLFVQKTGDYGPAWRILRPESITDQIYIKANRVRSIEEKHTQKIADDRLSEFIGIVNYSIMGLIQLHLGAASQVDMTAEEADKKYQQFSQQAKELMLKKNHDYDEAWRKMRISSYTDLILMKLFRIKQIEDSQGQTQVSEGIDANYMDIANYAVFAIIKLTE